MSAGQPSGGHMSPDPPRDPVPGPARGLPLPPPVPADLALDRFFLGRLRGVGIFEDRFGRLRRQFTVEVACRREAAGLRLDEAFRYADGASEARAWLLCAEPGGVWRGTARDVPGGARGRVSGNVFEWSYDMELRIGRRRLRVRFADRMVRMPDGILLSTAEVRKWGLLLGRVTLVFHRLGTGPDMGAD